MNRGEVWWGELPDIGRRPYLILTRSEAIVVLRRILVAPVTRTIRDIPSELHLGPDDGMPEECAASFDNVTTVLKSRLTQRICRLDAVRMVDACASLRAATACWAYPNPS